MKSFAYGLVATALMAGTALAQTTATPRSATNPAASPGTAPMAAPAAGMPGATTSPGMATAPTASSTTGMGTTGATGMGGTMANGRTAASGNDNQAVATTTANAGAPAHGANSFTMGEARRRIAARGFTNIANLKKDRSGVWRGTAQQNGTSTGVWLDYKGNVGQAAS